MLRMRWSNIHRGYGFLRLQMQPLMYLKVLQVRFDDLFLFSELQNKFSVLKSELAGERFFPWLVVVH